MKFVKMFFMEKYQFTICCSVTTTLKNYTFILKERDHSFCLISFSLWLTNRLYMIKCAQDQIYDMFIKINSLRKKGRRKKMEKLKTVREEATYKVKLKKSNVLYNFQHTFLPTESCEKVVIRVAVVQEGSISLQNFKLYQSIHGFSWFKL